MSRKATGITWFFPSGELHEFDGENAEKAHERWVINVGRMADCKVLLSTDEEVVLFTDHGRLDLVLGDN